MYIIATNEIGETKVVNTEESFVNLDYDNNNLIHFSAIEDGLVITADEPFEDGMVKYEINTNEDKQFCITQPREDVWQISEV